MYFVDDKIFYSRYKKGKRERKFYNGSAENFSKEEVTPLPDGYCRKRKIAYINSETHDIAIKEEIFIEHSK